MVYLQHCFTYPLMKRQKHADSNVTSTFDLYSILVDTIALHRHWNNSCYDTADRNNFDSILCPCSLNPLEPGKIFRFIDFDNFIQK